MTYEQRVEVKPTHAKVSAICFEAEDNVKLYERTLNFPQEVVPSLSHYEWESDGKVHLQLRKANAPSYWPELLTKSEGVTSNFEDRIAMWKAMHFKYSEIVEDYMHVYN